MADEQRVTQGGVTVAAELVDDGERVYQTGVTVAAELVEGGERVYQTGATVAAHLQTDAAPPTNLTQTPGKSSVRLDWTNNHKTPPVTGLRIKHSSNGVDFAKLADVNPDVVTHLHENLPPDTPVWHKIATLMGEDEAQETSAEETATVAGFDRHWWLVVMQSIERG